MRVTLIKPSVNFGKIYNKEIGFVPYEPLAIAILASLTPPDVEVKFYDKRLEDIPYNEHTDLVAISVDSVSARSAYTIAEEFRKRGVPVILGGIHPTLYPQEAINYSNSVVIGESEDLWRQLINDAERNKLNKFYYSKMNYPIGDIAPRRDIYKENYLNLHLVEIGRGCKYKCDFCCLSNIYNSYRYKPITSIVNEIEGLDKRKPILFINDNLTSDINFSKELFSALIPLKIKWRGFVCLDIIDNDEIFDLMAKSGCELIFVGFESLKKENILQMKKFQNIRVKYSSFVKKSRERGIAIYGTFIFGYDYDTADVFEKTLEFAIKNKLFGAWFNILQPMPGTPAYERLLSKNRLHNVRWWLEEEQKADDLYFIPESGLSSRQIIDGCRNAISKFYDWTSIFKRVEFKANCNSFAKAKYYIHFNLNEYKLTR